uniref:Uncharacterized protein n=1 Tax=Physcomitrium patens TaxID=3218 RepID=A0A2K1KJ13_PHYPA|nr:hypothetical protein PHYPA_007430 [Physcomitrium patens]
MSSRKDVLFASVAITALSWKFALPWVDILCKAPSSVRRCKDLYVQVSFVDCFFVVCVMVSMIPSLLCWESVLVHSLEEPFFFFFFFFLVFGKWLWRVFAACVTSRFVQSCRCLPRFRVSDVSAPARSTEL